MPRKPATSPQAADTSLQRIIESTGVELRPQGQDLVGPCPRHPDDDNQLVVHVRSNTWECPTCGKQGGPVEWVMHHTRVSRTRATDILRADAAPMVWPDDDHALLVAVVDYYHRSLLQDEAALDYLARRRLGDDRLIRHLRLGYSNRTLGYRLPSRNSSAGQSIRKRLQGLGILRDTGHEHMSGSITVPVLDGNGRVVDVYGRKLTPNLRAGTPLHLFLHQDPPAPWLLDPQADGDTVIVTSSVIDALSWWGAGFRAVLVVPTMKVTAEQVQAVVRGQTGRIVIALHRSADAAVNKILAALQAIGADVFRTVFPEDRDANDTLVSGGDLSGHVRHAEWLWSPPRAAASAKIESADAPDDGEPARAADACRDEVVVTYGDRRWRVRGLSVNTSAETLRVNVMVTRPDVGMHVDSFDMYSHRHRHGFVKQAAVELGVDERVVKADMGNLLLLLEHEQDERLKASDMSPEPIRMAPSERDEAMSLLRDPRLLDRIAEDMTAIGLVGEFPNKLVAYLAATLRLLDDPLAILVQSSSAAGKSTLLDGVLSLVPEEARMSFSAMTGQSLFYLGESDLRHKVLSIAEEEGASRASYSLKLLQSEGSITIASTGKDAGTGRMHTETYRVEGPVAIMMTTSGLDLDPELANRCIVLSVDEGREQTRAIQDRQRHAQTLEGQLARQKRDRILALHRNAQRLLEPIVVVNPHAPELAFADHQTRTRRDHQKYLTLIRSIALLHQCQRPARTIDHGGKALEYIEVTLADIDAANRLAHEVLGRSLDELPPQTRRVLNLIRVAVMEDCEGLGIAQVDYRFTRRQMRERLGCGNTQLRLHLLRLAEMEYVIAHRQAGTTQYELAWDGNGLDRKPFVMGLATPDPSAPSRPLVGPETGGGRAGGSTESSRERAADCDGGPQPSAGMRAQGGARRSRTEGK